MIDLRQLGRESWVYASGKAKLLSSDESRAINSRILHRYLTEEALADSPVGPAFAASDDITISLEPEKWRSWSAKETDEQYFGGMLGRDPERWFRPMDG
jgi:hypothetical protein